MKNGNGVVRGFETCNHVSGWKVSVGIMLCFMKGGNAGFSTSNVKEYHRSGIGLIKGGCRVRFTIEA